MVVYHMSSLLKLLFSYISLYLNPSIPRGNISDVTRYSNLMNFSVFDFLWRPQMHTACNTKTLSAYVYIFEYFQFAANLIMGIC